MKKLKSDSIATRLKQHLKPTAPTRQPSQIMQPPQPNFQLIPSSEQTLGRLIERVDALEKQLASIYKLLWRTSAVLIGLVASSTGLDWLNKFVHIFG
jgi:hypothetical protein